MSETEKCRLCGSDESLTNEHVPPQKSFNFMRSQLFSGDDVLKNILEQRYPWDFSASKGTQKQGGVSFKALCASCNNNTGRWYGEAFKEFYRTRAWHYKITL